jgi:hypothetical protein
MVLRSAVPFVLVLTLARPSLAQDAATVVVAPNAPYVIAVPGASYAFPFAATVGDHSYRFPDYRANEVLTQRNDNNRTGASHVRGINQNTASRFRKLGELAVGGVVTAQPLYARAAMVHNVRQPVLIVATSRNEVWAFPPSANSADGKFWSVPLGDPLVSKDLGVPIEGANCWIAPNAAWQEAGTFGSEPNGLVGIEATPVIDLANNQVLVGYKTKDGSQHLAAIDLNNGRARSVAVPPPHPGANPDWTKLHRNRASLLLANGVVYLAFSSLCEGTQQIMHGSIVAFDAKTLDHVGSLQITDDNTDGAGIWQATTGLAADTIGNLYFITGNRRLPPKCLVGFADRNPPDAANLANSVIRLRVEKRGPGGAPPHAGERYTVAMTVEDFFTPYRKILGDCGDLDLGSAGTVLMPGTPYIVAGGKEGIVYVLDRADLGRFHDAGQRWKFANISAMYDRGGTHADVPDDPAFDHVRQKFQAGENLYDSNYKISDLMKWPHIHGTPVVANFGADQTFMFVWPEKDRIKRYRWLGDRFDTSPARGPTRAPPHRSDKAVNGMPGGMLSVNVDPTGPRLGVVMASVKICDEPDYDACNVSQDRGILRAFDPFSMREVWSNRGEKYFFAKFVPPTVAAGRVFLPTASGKVLIYGP